MDRRHFIIGAGAVAASSRAAQAADEVVIGVVYPLTGNGAAVGLDAKAAYEVAARIINDAHPPLGVAMGKGGGLDKLGGAKIRLVFADSQMDPQKARAEAERLITQDKAVAIVGSYTSATGATISQVTERYEVPYISADNSVSIFSSSSGGSHRIDCRLSTTPLAGPRQSPCWSPCMAGRWQSACSG